MRIISLFVLLFFGPVSPLHACLPDFAVTLILKSNQVDFAKLRTAIRFPAGHKNTDAKVVFRNPAHKNYVFEVTEQTDPGTATYYRVVVLDRRGQAFHLLETMESRKAELRQVLREEMNRLRRNQILLGLTDVDLNEMNSQIGLSRTVYFLPSECSQKVDQGTAVASTHGWTSVYGQSVFRFDAQGCVDIQRTLSKAQDSTPRSCGGDPVATRDIGELVIP